MDMKRLAAAASLAALMMASGPAFAAGCLKGAVVGGVAGHYAHHHAILGAMAGCAVGHHMAAKAARERAIQQQQRQAAHGSQGAY
jgi:hypothetical protein